MILPFTVGREKEIEALLRSALAGRSVLLVGPSGVGKTHVLLELQRRLRLTGAAVRYLPKPVPPKNVADSIYGWLSSLAGISRPRRLDAAKVHQPEAGAAIADVLSLAPLRERRIVILADDLDLLPAPALPIWEVLTERAVVVGAGFKERSEPRFARLLHRFDRVVLEPLDSREAEELAHQVADDVRVDSARTREFLSKRLAALSNGIPRAVVESVERLKGAGVVDEIAVRGIEPHRSGAAMGDATPMFLLVGLAFMIARLYARGMYMLDAWAIFGAFAALFGYAGLYLRRGRREVS